MLETYQKILISNNIPGQPYVVYDNNQQKLVHVYQNVIINTNIFQKEINQYINRKTSTSQNVIQILRLKDQHISINSLKPHLQISVVTNYVPFRLETYQGNLSYEEAIAIIHGALKGYQQLLFRVRLPFLVDQSMIGVDIDGNVRVWWNKIFYRSSFGFSLTPQIKLKQMLKSLIKCFGKKMAAAESFNLQDQLLKDEIDITDIEQKIKKIINQKNIQISTTLKKLINSLEEVKIVKNKIQIQSPRQNKHSRLASTIIGAHETVILADSQLQFRQRNKLITKRTYQGTSPDHISKMKIIKQDIQNLRHVVSHANYEASSPLKKVKSVDSLFSIQKSLKGDKNIPQVNKVINSEEIIGKDSMIKINRFVDNKNNQSSSFIKNPQNCNVCINLNQLRQSQITLNQNSPRQLSRIRSYGDIKGLHKKSESSITIQGISGFDTNQSLLQNKNKFGDSQKKINDKSYFSRVLDNGI